MYSSYCTNPPSCYHYIKAQGNYSSGFVEDEAQIWRKQNLGESDSVRILILKIIEGKTKGGER